MLWNYIKGTLRNISAHKSISLINILGLVIGIICALIVSLYVIHETGYDDFHSNSKNIYRVTVHGQVHDLKFDGATSTGALAKAIYKENKNVLKTTRVAKFGAWLVTHNDIRYNEDNIYFVDTNFLMVFDGFEVLKGNPKTMFEKPRSVVLTEKTALKYFNSFDVIGKDLMFETGEKPFTVTGLLKNPPTNTHIPFDMLASVVTYEKNISFWTNNNIYTYIVLKDKTYADIVEKQLNGFVEKYILTEFSKVFENAFAENDKYYFALQPLLKIHLYSDLQGEMEQNGKAVYVYTFGIVAILILIIACLNFMNLTSADSINRSYEVTVRKVSGADKKMLILQFLTESVIYSFIALVIALLLTEIILPVFNNYLGLALEFHAYNNLPAVLLILVFAIIIGLISGSYPALFISSFEPVKVLQGVFGQGLSNSKVRAVFVIIQFSISILIITLTIIIYSQIRFMMDKDLGFDKDHVIVIRRSDALKENLDIFKREILLNPDIIATTNSNSIPGRDMPNTAFRINGEKDNTALLLNQLFVKSDFCDAYKLQIVQGRFFDSSIPADSFACVINESAAKLIGLSYPVGSKLQQPRMFKKTDNNYTIIGVVKDFHFQSVEKPVQPLVLCYMPGNWEGYINVKINPTNMSGSINYIERVWNLYAPQYPFVYFNLNEDFNKSYTSLIKLGRIFIVFSILAIFVAVLGLFGLISFMLNQRAREISIRKALGASVSELIIMLVKESLQLLLISAVIAWIIAFLLARYWLTSFYYRIDLHFISFIYAAFFVIIIALALVIFQAYKATRLMQGVILKH